MVWLTRSLAAPAAPTCHPARFALLRRGFYALRRARFLSSKLTNPCCLLLLLFVLFPAPAGRRETDAHGGACTRCLLRAAPFFPIRVCSLRRGLGGEPELRGNDSSFTLWVSPVCGTAEADLGLLRVFPFWGALLVSGALTAAAETYAVCAPRKAFFLLLYPNTTAYY